MCLNCCSDTFVYNGHCCVLYPGSNFWGRSLYIGTGVLVLKGVRLRKFRWVMTVVCTISSVAFVFFRGARTELL